MQFLQNIPCSAGLFKASHAESCLLCEKTSCLLLRKIFWKGKGTEWLAISVWPKVLTSQGPCLSDQLYSFCIMCPDWLKVLRLEKETSYLMLPSFFPNSILSYINFLYCTFFSLLSLCFLNPTGLAVKKKTKENIHYK